MLFWCVESEVELFENTCLLLLLLYTTLLKLCNLFIYLFMIKSGCTVKKRKKERRLHGHQKLCIYRPGRKSTHKKRKEEHEIEKKKEEMGWAHAAEKHR